MAPGGFPTRPRNGPRCFSTQHQAAATQHPGPALDVTSLFSLKHRVMKETQKHYFESPLHMQCPQGCLLSCCGHNQPCPLSHFHQWPWTRLKTIFLSLVHSENPSNTWVTTLVHEHPKPCTSVSSVPTRTQYKPTS